MLHFQHGRSCGVLQWINAANLDASNRGLLDHAVPHSLPPLGLHIHKPVSVPTLSFVHSWKGLHWFHWSSSIAPCIFVTVYRGTDGTRMHYGEPVEALSIILLCVWQSH